LAELDGGGVGDVPLLPVAHWLLGRGGHHDRFSQAALLTAPEGLGEPALAGALLHAAHQEGVQRLPGGEACQARHHHDPDGAEGEFEGFL
ncbi:hypothetical protein, partial [Rhodococcus sp. (in: high G+C Gram-positive bacteria)]|uniref:hypothetical protein n=1 Tax=Rhodococcus sp. TaxID=1831 RepID=UPI003B8A664A